MLAKRLRSRFQSVIGRIQMAAYAALDPGVSGRALGSGLAYIDIAKGARLEFGKGVKLLSTRIGYHARLDSPVQLMAGPEGALITIGDRTRLNGCCVRAGKEVRIGSDCLFASGVTVMDSNGHKLAPTPLTSRNQTQDECRPVWIGDGVWLGLGVLVLPGTIIGDGSVIAAGSVVSGEIPPGVLAGGVPAKVIRKL